MVTKGVVSTVSFHELSLSGIGRNRMTEFAISQQIQRTLRERAETIREGWSTSSPVRHVAIDDLLDQEVAEQLASQFPRASELSKKQSLKEKKRVGVDVDQYPAIVGETLFAFQDPKVVELVGEVTGIAELMPDPSLYASGLSAMATGGFLNPHLDNSHDGDGKRYRAINLLYYVTPDWEIENGGNLELWDTEVTHPKTIHSKFNRLVLMQTNDTSWHSVSKVKADGQRNCVSNYYFTDASPTGEPYKHVTSFAGRPDDSMAHKVALSFDRRILNFLGKTFPFLTKVSGHRIDKDETGANA